MGIEKNHISNNSGHLLKVIRLSPVIVFSPGLVRFTSYSEMIVYEFIMVIFLFAAYIQDDGNVKYLKSNQYILLVYR